VHARSGAAGPATDNAVPGGIGGPGLDAAPIRSTRLVGDRDEALGVTDAADVAWMLARLGPTPFGHFTEPVVRRNPASRNLARSYIRCGQWFNPNFDRFAAAARRAPGWRAFDLALPHIPYVTHPQEIVEVLLEAAGARGATAGSGSRTGISGS